jgi:hypothetical protein
MGIDPAPPPFTPPSAIGKGHVSHTQPRRRCPHTNDHIRVISVCEFRRVEIHQTPFGV